MKKFLTLLLALVMALSIVAAARTTPTSLRRRTPPMTALTPLSPS